MYSIKLLFILSWLMVHIPYQSSNTGNWTIYSKDFNNNKGKAILFLFRKEDEIPSRPFKIVKSSIKDKKAVFEIENLPFDKYALILLHDENDNDQIDHSLGFPDEQLGYSNHWQLGFFSGMPTFSKLAIPFSADMLTQNINITYKKNKN